MKLLAILAVAVGLVGCSPSQRGPKPIEAGVLAQMIVWHMETKTQVPMHRHMDAGPRFIMDDSLMYLVDNRGWTHVYKVTPCRIR